MLRVNILVLFAVMMVSGKELHAQSGSFLEYKVGFVVSNYLQTDQIVQDQETENRVDQFMLLALNQQLKNSPLYFRFELSYKGLGAELDVPVTNNPTDRRRISTQFDNNYIGFSLQTGVILFRESKINPKFYIGPSVEFLTDSKLTFRQRNNAFGSEFDIIARDIGDETENRQFGINMGLGVDWKVGAIAIGVDGRYFTSFSNIFDDSSSFVGGPNDDPFEDVKHESFGVIIGFHFPL